MSPSAHTPRNYQIEELTRGIQYPLPAIKWRHLKVISEFLEEAWDSLLITQSQNLRTKEEVEVVVYNLLCKF